MFQSGYMSVLQAGNPKQLLSEVLRFVKRLGFDTVSAMVVVDHPLGESEFFTIDNAPPAYRALSSDREAARRDPVMQHCKAANLPITWGQATYTAKGEGEMWEEQARYGYGHGIAMATHLPGGRHFMLGADRDKRLPGNEREVLRMVADLQLLTVFAQEAAFRILAPESEEPAPPSLTSRELDSLRWTMEGKTAREVGELLGTGERTTVMYLQQAMRKLGCISKHQAALKALRMGLFR